MPTWWYADSGKKTGPVEAEELQRLLLAAKITQETMLWREGMEAWQPLKTITELDGLRAAVPPAIPTKAHADPLTFPMATRWTRFFARMFDLWWEALVLGFLIGAVLGRYSAAYVEWINKPGSGQLFALMLLPLAFALDALIYAALGNTPGKALFGIRATTFNGGPLTLGQYLERNFQIWARGLAVGFPIANLFTLAYQSRRLQRTQFTTYDESAKFAVRAVNIGTLRKVGAVLAFVGLFAIMAVLNAVQTEAEREAPLSSEPPYSWSNPITGLKAKVHSRWKNSTQKNESGDELYQFADHAGKALILLGVQHWVGPYVLRDYVDGLRKGTKAHMRFADGGRYMESNGHQMWIGTGTMVDDPSNRLNVRVIQVKDLYWRIVIVQAPPYDYSDTAVRELETELWGTVTSGSI